MFSKFGKNYLEHIVLNAYITGQQSIIYASCSLLTLVVDSTVVGTLPLLLSVSYTFLVFWQFFAGGNRAMNILRTVLTYALYMVLSLVLVFLLLALLGVD